MNRYRIYPFVIVVSLAMAYPFAAFAVAPASISCNPTMADYTSYPVFQANTVEPNILIILDNSISMDGMAYESGYRHTTTYYGYFEPFKKYSYGSNVFTRSASGTWDGNFLNWATMRRVDVVRKVLTGGKAESAQGGGAKTLVGNDGNYQVQYYEQKTNTTNVPAGLSPCPNNRWFKITLDGNTLSLYSASTSSAPSTYSSSWSKVGDYTIKVQKGDVADEDYLFHDYALGGTTQKRIAGIMQRLWTKAKFALEYFNYGVGNGENGGRIEVPFGSSGNDTDPLSRMLTAVRGEDCSTFTPLAESYYTAIRYFQQEDPEAAMSQQGIPNNNDNDDPFYRNSQYVSCAKSFVILLTDGESTKDLKVPDALKDYDGDGNDGMTEYDTGTSREGRMVYKPGGATSDDLKFYLSSGATPFNANYKDKYLVLYDENDHQVFYNKILDTYPSPTLGTNAIYLSGTTNTPEWSSGMISGVTQNPYDSPSYTFSWKVVTPTSNTEDTGYFPLNGSNYLDDLALYARTNDLRATGSKALEGDQNLYLYTVYAFGTNATARNLLKDAAKNGAFEDKNGNNRPDLASEYDSNGDGVPDAYYEADEGYQLEAKLIQAINDILKRAASGTAVSVLATSGEGEGNLVQAYFRPSVVDGVTEVRWVGYLQSLWVDPKGNLREDTNGNLTLDTDADKVVAYFLDSGTNEAKIKRFAVSGASPYPDVSSGAYEIVTLEEISPLWEAGSLLSEKTAESRNIFTYIDKNKNAVADDSPDAPFDSLGEVVKFHTDSVAEIMPYLGVKDATAWSYLGGTTTDRALNLIRYIRGQESGFSGTTGLQVRTRTIGSDVWKLGDIVHSTPVTISKPPDNYHIIYADESYQSYYNAQKNRETVVYVGANDGMLHAFTSWQYDGSTKQYTKPAGAPGTEQIGEEIWAYIPQNLLPHLKWLPDKNYTHVYYADLKPKVFDAKIDGNWCTILLLGLNLGGKQICVEDDFPDGSGGTVNETRQFYPSYTALDVTNPRQPKLLWERTYKDLGFSMSSPAIVKVQDKWFAVFGSGPTDYDGTSTNKGHIYVVDLETGDGFKNASLDPGTKDGWLFECAESDAFMNSPVSMDKDLNYSVDAIYFGETYFASNAWKGKVYKVAIPWDWPEDYSDTSTYQITPNASTDPWTLWTLFETDNPITAPLSLSIDFQDNVWVYFGTGRYLSQDDKTNDDTQYLFGIKDPFFNSAYKTAPNDYYHSYSKALTLESGDLFNASTYLVMTDGTVFNNTTEFGDWDDLLAAARAEDGWYRTLSLSKERSITKFSVLGGAVFAPTYIPNEDICGYGGDSWLYGLYFETGTAYYEPFLPSGPTTVTLGGDTYQRVEYKMSLGVGKSSALGIHVGQESGAKAFIQQSTGAVLEANVGTAFNIKSGLINWRQK